MINKKLKKGNSLQFLHHLRFITLFLLCFISTPSQSTRSFPKSWWVLTYNDHYKGYLYMVEPQIRWVDRRPAYEQFMLNAGGGVSLNSKLQVWVGQTYSDYARRDDITDDVSDRVTEEYRNWQQVIWIPIPHSVLLRSRLEERRSFENPRWGVRLRERLYWQTPFSNNTSLVLSDEFFINVNHVPWIRTSTLDQNRAYAGIQQKLTSTFSMNVSYMNQNIFRKRPESNPAVVVNFYVNM